MTPEWNCWLDQTTKERLIRRAIQIVNLSRWQSDEFYVDRFLNAKEFVTHTMLIQQGTLISKPALRAIGVRANRKISKDYWRSLNSEGRRDLDAAARRISSAVNAALHDRARLIKMTQELSPRVPVRLSASDNCCDAARSWNNVTWAIDAPDLPLSGCDAQCLCFHSIELDQ